LFEQLLQMPQELEAPNHLHENQKDLQKKKITYNSSIDGDLDQNELLNAVKLCAFKLDYDQLV